jgi:putative hydrolase of the HAD superfamily
VTVLREYPSIRGIVFDYGGVICTFDYGAFFRRLGNPADRTIPDAGALLAGSDLPRRYEAGEISSWEFYRGISDLFGFTADEEEFASAFSGIFRPIESTFRLIRRLSRTYRLGLLSNTNPWHYERNIREAEIFPLFDAVTLSFQAKAMKPAEGIYRDLLGKIALRAEECVFIDDLEENVAGARRLNLHVIRYEGHERLVSALADLGVRA